MKKILIILTVCLFLLTSCASLMPKQFIEDNVFYCSHPEVKIKVSPEFKYLCEVKYNREGDSVDGTRSLRCDMHSYVFIRQNTVKPYLKKQFQIRTDRIETYFISDIYGDIKDKLECGIQKLGGKNYHYYTRIIYPSMENAVTKHLFEEGYIIPECVLVKVFARVEGVEGSFIISVAYLEDVSDTGYPCAAWMDKDKLTDDQKQYIKDFGERFANLFEIIEYTPENKMKDVSENLIKDLINMDWIGTAMGFWAAGS